MSMIYARAKAGLGGASGLALVAMLAGLGSSPAHARDDFRTCGAGYVTSLTVLYYGDVIRPTINVVLDNSIMDEWEGQSLLQPAITNGSASTANTVSINDPGDENSAKLWEAELKVLQSAFLAGTPVNILMPPGQCAAASKDTFVAVCSSSDDMKCSAGTHGNNHH